MKKKKVEAIVEIREDHEMETNEAIAKDIKSTLKIDSNSVAWVETVIVSDYEEVKSGDTEKDNVG